MGDEPIVALQSRAGDLPSAPPLRLNSWDAAGDPCHE